MPRKLAAAMGLHDITDWLRTTCQELAPGEMIRPDSLQLLDAMNAVEVGHIKTDTGLVEGVSVPPAPFDPFTPLTAEELCWVFDRLVQLEISWHQGTPICQNVYTSLYYHNFQYLFTGDHNSPSKLIAQLDLDDTPRPMELVTVVLKAYILSYRKTLDLVFVELAKGNVIDGEDCWLDDYGLGICMSDEVEEVLELGASAEAWLSSEQCTVEETWREALLIRLQFRNRLLNCIARLVEPPGWPRITSFGLAELQRSHTSMGALDQPPEPSASSSARAAFDERIYSSLRQHMPLPKLEVPDRDRTKQAVQSLMDGLAMSDVLGRTESLTIWELAIRGKLWSGEPMLAFVRSLLISTLSPTRDTLFRQHGLSVDWLADTWLCERCGLEPGGMRTLGEVLQGTGAEIMALPSFRRWRDILTGNVVNTVTISLYNRPRHRRNLLSSALTFAELADDARAYTRATERFPASIALALDALRLDACLEGALLGWELDLVDRIEEREAWWWVWTLATRRVEMSTQLAGSGRDWRAAFARFMSHAASGMLRMLTLLPLSVKPTTFSIPMQRRAFSLRHKRAIKRPLQPLGAVVYEERLYPEFEAWCDCRTELDALERQTLASEATESLDEALKALTAFEQSVDRSDWERVFRGLRDDLQSNLVVARNPDKQYSWDWNERVNRLDGPRWLLRLVPSRDA